MALSIAHNLSLFRGWYCCNASYARNYGFLTPPKSSYASSFDTPSQLFSSNLFRDGPTLLITLHNNRATSVAAAGASLHCNKERLRASGRGSLLYEQWSCSTYICHMHMYTMISRGELHAQRCANNMHCTRTSVLNERPGLASTPMRAHAPWLHALAALSDGKSFI